MSKFAQIKISLTVFFLLFLVAPGFVLAQRPFVAKPNATAAATVKQRIQERTEVRTEKIAEVKQQQASRAAALKVKLQAFRDKTKAALAEKIANTLNLINQKQTEAMQKHLSIMSNILDKLETRVNLSTADIKDPVATRAAIATARQTISTASAAVTAQATKDYTIQVTSESRIRVDAKTQRDKLHTDLQSLRKIIIDAKQSVGNAIRVAKSGSITTDTKEGTASGQQ